jgi:excisionase family DNA binding protein
MLVKEETGKDMENGEHMSNMLTVREVADLLHVHPNTLRRWSNKGVIRAYRITPRGDRRFKREEIDRFLTELNGHGDDWQEIESGQRSR